MVKKQRKKIFLVTAGLSLVGLVYMVLALSPEASLNAVIFSFPLYYLSFFLVFLFLYSLTAFLFKSFIHGILVGLFPVVYLSMRLYDLTGLLFLVLLTALFIALEILLVQLTRKSPKLKP